MRGMKIRRVVPTLVALLLAPGLGAQEKREFKYAAGPNSSVTIVNPSGRVSVRGGSGNQVLIQASFPADKVEIDSRQAGSRIEARTHALQKGETAVEYQVTVPAGVPVTIRAGNGPVVIENLAADITVDSEKGEVEVRKVRDAHVHVRNMSGTTTLTDITRGHIEITTVGGAVRLYSVSGPKLSVGSAGGDITYSGDFGGPGEYSLTTNTGSIEVALASSASVDLAAHSVAGSVQSEFPFQPKEAGHFAPAKGSSFFGTSKDGSSSVQLRSLSGKIRVTKK